MVPVSSKIWCSTNQMAHNPYDTGTEMLGTLLGQQNDLQEPLAAGKYCISWQKIVGAPQCIQAALTTLDWVFHSQHQQTKIGCEVAANRVQALDKQWHSKTCTCA